VERSQGTQRGEKEDYDLGPPAKAILRHRAICLLLLNTSGDTVSPLGVRYIVCGVRAVCGRCAGGVGRRPQQTLKVCAPCAGQSAPSQNLPARLAASAQGVRLIAQRPKIRSREESDCVHSQATRTSHRPSHLRVATLRLPSGGLSIRQLRCARLGGPLGHSQICPGKAPPRVHAKNANPDSEP